MKNLFTLILAIFCLSFAFTSCGDDDEDDNPCTVCKLEVQLLEDCEIQVCEDGTSETLSGTLSCVEGEAALLSLTTQAEKVQALRDAGYTCN